MNSEYKSYLLNQLGLTESHFKLTKTDPSKIDTKELEIGIYEENFRINDKELSKRLALENLSKNPRYYSELQRTSLKEGIPSFKSLVSPTAIQTPVIALAVRGSSTGGLPSGADRNMKPSTLGGYEKVTPAMDNSILVDKTPTSRDISSSTPIAKDAEQPVPSNPHPHEVENNAGEPPQAVTGAEENSDSDKNLTVSGDQESAKTETDDQLPPKDDPTDSSIDIDISEKKFSNEKLNEIKQSLSKKAQSGKMSDKESKLYSMVYEVLSKRIAIAESNKKYPWEDVDKKIKKIKDDKKEQSDRLFFKKRDAKMDAEERRDDLAEVMDFSKEMNKPVFIKKDGSHLTMKKAIFQKYLSSLFAYLSSKLNLKEIPKVVLRNNKKNAENILGLTAYYDSNNKVIYLYITDRHDKDILRSFAHEVIHHWQNENGKLGKEDSNTSDPQYAQNNQHLRQMEKQAFLLGNILFRDWSDMEKVKK